MVLQFRPATKKQRKARIGLIGPSGSGKTYSALTIASGLGERVGLIDTENRSSEVYADEFAFQVLELNTFSPEKYVQAIRIAEDSELDVLIIDSLSHAWIGKDGALDQVDAAAARSRSGNTFMAWREITPRHNALVDALLRCKCHLIVTMRAKTEYIIEQDNKGRSVPRKIGMAPIQRDGLEYEFDIVGDMDWNNNLIITKTRCKPLSGQVFHKPGADVSGIIRTWLESGEKEPSPQANEQDTARNAPALPGHTMQTSPSVPPKAFNRNEMDALLAEAEGLGWSRDEVADLLKQVREDRQPTFKNLKPSEFAALAKRIRAGKPGAYEIQQ